MTTMKKLDTFLRQHRIKRYVFADHIGIGQGYLSDILTDKAAPSLVVAAKIEKATGGAVRCIDLVDAALLANIEGIE